MSYYGLLLVLSAASAAAQTPAEAIALNQRGLEAESRRDYAESETDYRRSAAIFRTLGPRFEAHLSIELFNLAEAMCWQGKWREVEGVFEESLTLTRRALGPKNIRTLAGLNALGNVVTILGNTARADALLGEALEIGRENFPADLQFAHTLAGLSSLRLRAGKPDEGLAFADEALRIALKAETPEGQESATMYQSVAQARQAAGGLELALPLFRKARAILERLGQTTDPRYASLLSQEGLALMNDGKLALAEADMKRAIQLLSGPPVAAFELAVAQNNLGMLRMRQKKYAEAEALLAKALSGEQDVAQIGRTREALAQVRSALR